MLPTDGLSAGRGRAGRSREGRVAGDISITGEAAEKTDVSSSPLPPQRERPRRVGDSTVLDRHGNLGSF